MPPAWDFVRFIFTVGGLLLVLIQSGRWWGGIDSSITQALRSIERIEALIAEQAKAFRAVELNDGKQQMQLNELQERMKRIEERLHERHQGR